MRKLKMKKVCSLTPKMSFFVISYENVESDEYEKEFVSSSASEPNSSFHAIRYAISKYKIPIFSGANMNSSLCLEMCEGPGEGDKFSDFLSEGEIGVLKQLIDEKSNTFARFWNIIPNEKLQPLLGFFTDMAQAGTPQKAVLAVEKIDMTRI